MIWQNLTLHEGLVPLRRLIEMHRRHNSKTWYGESHRIQTVWLSAQMLKEESIHTVSELHYVAGSVGQMGTE